MIKSGNMEKPKFALPAPNFDKNGIQKPQPHYLTPSGMTLLTREKQPPPMYGPKGSTVPPKFLQQNVVTKPPEEPPKRPYCEPCEMELQSVEDFRRHRLQHERCPVDGCKFRGHPNVMDKHVTELHASGIFDKIKKLSTPEEIAAWREERRRKYPTLANAKVRQLAQEQRERRGERLHENKARFGRQEDRKRARSNNNKGEGESIEYPKRMRNFEKNDRKGKNKRTNAMNTQKPLEKNIEEKKPENLKMNVENIDDIVVCGIQMFRGTSKLEDYKHEMPVKKIFKNALAGLVGMYGSSDDEYNDSENDSTACQSDTENLRTSENNQMKHDLQNINEAPLTNIVGHELTSERETGQSCTPSEQELLNVETYIDKAHKTEDLNDKTKKDEFKAHEKILEDNASTKEKTFESKSYGVEASNTDIADKETNANESSDGEPEEVPIQRVTTLPDINPTTSTEGANSSQEETMEAKRLRIEESRKKLQEQRTYNVNVRRRKLRKQNTMLEKLLEPEIRHERNVLLQCVRFVCENNFFGIGAEKVGNDEKVETKT